MLSAVSWLKEAFKEKSEELFNLCGAAVMWQKFEFIKKRNNML